MPTPILATKLYIPPPRPKVVLRPRLIARLNAGLHRKLTLISAPAGFGKTTLISEWLAGCERPAAWLSLDEGDSEPTRFLTYLVAALQTLALSDSTTRAWKATGSPKSEASGVSPVASQARTLAEVRGPSGREGLVGKFGEGVLALLHAPQPLREPAGREVMLTTLLNEITTIPDDFILVLDDYHVIDAAPRGYPPLGAVDTALAFLLEHLPPQMHLVITTREDPQLPLARLRARGQMTELRATDLRFTAAEAAGFLNQVMDLDLSAEEVTVLEDRTEGWIAGLQLAALSMQGRADVARFVSVFAGDNRYIVDYLVEEVLQRQPESVRRFLLQTAILDRLSGSLCDAVTEQNDGMLLLDALERGNLFVVPLDDQRHWFRYHHLFADVLAAHARQEQPAQVPILHQRASAWYAANHLPADAIRHALAAQDFACAADLVERAWPAMDGRFQSTTWLGWVRALPDALVRARPVLNVAHAWALMNGGELEAAEARFGDAERWLDPSAEQHARPEAAPKGYPIIVDEEQYRNLPASIATARAYLTQARGDLPGSVKYSRRALDLLPEADHLRRGPAAALLGLAQWASGDLEAAYRALADAMTGFQKVGNFHFAISVTSGLADIRTVQGRLGEAVRCYAQALQLALAQGEPLIRGTANLYLGLSELHLEQGKLEIASQHLLRTEELGDQAGLPDWRYRLCRAQARFKATAGDLAGALDLLDAAERHYRRTPVPDVRPLAALKTRVWVAQGRLREARRWVQEMGLSVDDQLSYLREFEHITLARLLMAEYKRDHADRAIREAMALLDRLQPAAEAGGRLGSVIEILVLQALAHQAQGNLAGALVALERALRLAEPEDYVRIFVDEGATMAQLLSEAAARGMMLDYVGQLLATFEDTTMDDGRTTNVRPSSIVHRPSSLIEPLSPRELEVLQLIAQGLSNNEISQKLFLALSTVKGHNRLIFGKLQVERRTEAVARGRELGLV